MKEGGRQIEQTFPISIVQLISIENLKINWPQLINTDYQLNPIDIWFPIDINWTIWHQLRSNKHAFSLPDTTPSWIHSSHNVFTNEIHLWCCEIVVLLRFDINWTQLIFDIYQLEPIDIQIFNWYQLKTEYQLKFNWCSNWY